MDHLEHPTPELWEERREWYEAVYENSQHPLAGYLVSEQACALTADVQAAFCSGAWIAVLVLSAAVVEATLTECEVPAVSVNFKLKIGLSSADPDLHWLRRRRNELVHLDPDSPGITVDQQWEDRDSLEEDARRAITLMFGAMFQSPCV